MLLQVMPDTPAIDQLAVPVGVAPKIGPETVAAKVKAPPSNTVGELVLTEIDGINFETVML